MSFAEAETLSLLKASATTSAQASTPVKLKQMDVAAGVDSPPKNSTPSGNRSGKGQSTPMGEQPCRFFRSESGCKARKACKWSHSWEGICGGKDNRKFECRLKSTSNKPASSEPGLGGGRGGGANTKTAVKNVAVQGKGAHVPTPKSNTEQTFSSTTPEVSALGAEGNSQGTSSSATVEVEKGGAPATSVGTTELLAEATQLLKPLRMPNMKVMRLSSMEPTAQVVLLDSGATHGLRPAASQEEWDSPFEAGHQGPSL